ncbi:MAG TPA: multidrug efflux RND transporter permease subunit [Herbaspirillum sp.]|jgi:multidrug efflux pump
MSRFFIDRPIFAWVISLLIMLAGLLALRVLPVAQYPDIAPPMIGIYASYPGASAKVVEDTVTAVIEREMSGAPGLMYSGASSSAGRAIVNLTFRQDINADMAAVEVQNRLKTIEPILPEAVRRNGVAVEKSIDNDPILVSLTSEDGALDSLALGEFASSNLIQSLRRVEGVGKVELWGAEHAMRIWLDPVRMRAAGIGAGQLVDAVRNSNAPVTIGDIGTGAVPASAPFSANILPPDGLSGTRQFGDIALRTDGNGGAITLRDVARLELGQDQYNYVSLVGGKHATAIAINLAPGSNALATIERIRALLDQASATFPSGVHYQIPFEPSAFVKASIRKVMATLAEAVLLVFLVMYLFMQNLRATLIPTLVVPVSLLGTLGVLLAAGYSINVLTLFGMVLAIGILVDDAIVVVENVERLMHEHKLSPYRATIEAMRQIGSAIIGMTVVLMSVFVPMAFFGGVVGNIYKQFAVTLAVSIGFSAFLALTLTPALCAALLKPAAGDHHQKRGFFGWFNRAFLRWTGRYGEQVGRVVRKPLRWMLVYLAIGAAVALLAWRLPSAFLPAEDQGDLTIAITTPQGTPAARTLERVAIVERYLREHEPVAFTYAMTGYSPFGRGANAGSIFVTLKDWKHRPDRKDGVDAIAERINEEFDDAENMEVFAFNSSGLPGLGSAGGFSLRLQDRAGLGPARLAEARDQLLAAAKKEVTLANVRFPGMPDMPQLQMRIDRRKAQATGVSIADINTTLAVMFSSDYIGDFVLGNQVRKVIAQADGEHRVKIDDVLRLTVPNRDGGMVPVSSFASLKWTLAPPQLSRYNGYPSVAINGDAAPGSSSGAAMRTMERLMAGLPPGIGYEWSGQSYQERLSGAQAPLLFALSILIVFLALAALYESWSIPLAVILMVPLGILGALAGVSLRGLPNDIYFKVGLVATIGLSAKNAILIIEVAKDLHRQGMDLADAAVEAARRRLRPIVMTSLSFGFGVIPLALAGGAGSAAQIAIGTGVLGGIVTATALAIFFVPLFFVAVGRCFSFKKSANE